MIVHEVEKQQDDGKKFSAIKKLKKKKLENPTVHDNKGKNVTEANQIHQTVYDDFKKQLFDKDVPSIKIFKRKQQSISAA